MVGQSWWKKFVKVPHGLMTNSKLSSFVSSSFDFVAQSTSQRVCSQLCWPHVSYQTGQTESSQMFLLFGQKKKILLWSALSWRFDFVCLIWGSCTKHFPGCGHTSATRQAKQNVARCFYFLTTIHKTCYLCRLSWWLLFVFVCLIWGLWYKALPHLCALSCVGHMSGYQTGQPESSQLLFCHMLQ